MCRGFSLLELLTSLVIMGILLSIGFGYAITTQRSQQIQSAGQELLSFIETAKSVAHSRRTSMWIDIQSTSEAGEWSLDLMSQDDSRVLVLNGQRFPLVSLQVNYREERILLLGERGKISNGSLVITSSTDAAQGLKLITSYGAGRVRLCSIKGAAYGYLAC